MRKEVAAREKYLTEKLEELLNPKKGDTKKKK